MIPLYSVLIRIPRMIFHLDVSAYGILPRIHQENEVFVSPGSRFHLLTVLLSDSRPVFYFQE